MGPRFQRCLGCVHEALVTFATFAYHLFTFATFPLLSNFVQLSMGRGVTTNFNNMEYINDRE
jgi:hypothetical protein